MWPLYVEQSQNKSIMIYVDQLDPSLSYRRLLGRLVPVRGLRQKQAAPAQSAKPRYTAARWRREIRWPLLRLWRDQCRYWPCSGLAGMLGCSQDALRHHKTSALPAPPGRFRFTFVNKFGSAMAFMEARLRIASHRGSASCVLSLRNAAKLSWRRTVSR
jgi:hypothetical protein